MQSPACQPGEVESRGQWLTGNLLREKGWFVGLSRNMFELMGIARILCGYEMDTKSQLSRGMSFPSQMLVKVCFSRGSN